MTDEPDAVFTAARDSDAELSSEDVLTARLIGTLAFDRAHAILGEDRIVFEPVALSPRQVGPDVIGPVDVQSFCATASAATSSAILFNAVQDITARMGFRHFALVHHINVRRPDGTAVRLVDYPSDWVDVFEERRLYASDPIHRASQKTSTGFLWAHVDKMISLTVRDRAVLAAAREVGIGEGFTIPAHIPGEVNGSCSFAMGASDELDKDQLPLVQLVGNFAFEAARRINRPVGVTQIPTAQLTDRQVECVALVARGKTDWEIARILGEGSETVTGVLLSTAAVVWTSTTPVRRHPIASRLGRA